VIEGCAFVQIKPSNGSPLPARILVHDATNDLPLLKADQPTDKFVTVRAGVRLGDSHSA
jgi:S1-C subfamily serine protease